MRSKNQSLFFTRRGRQSAGKILDMNICKQVLNSGWRRSPKIKDIYFAGFADGEGSFNVSLRKRDDHHIGWQVVLTFNVSQKESYILSQFKKLLGCGRLQTRPDGVYYYVVSNPRSLNERVIPFFQRFPFLSQRKKRNFAIFQRILTQVMEKKSIDPQGLHEIAKLRETLNLGIGRKRKYVLGDIQQSLQENPQRLHVRPRAFRKETSRMI